MVATQAVLEINELVENIFIYLTPSGVENRKHIDQHFRSLVESSKQVCKAWVAVPSFMVDILEPASYVAFRTHKGLDLAAVDVIYKGTHLEAH